MKKIITISLILLLATGFSVAADSPDALPLLTVNLRASSTISNNSPTLSDIAELTGDKLAVNLASKITIGKISTPSQKLIIDNNIILSRLASSGITSSDVKLTGSAQAIISLDHKNITGNDFATLAVNYLKRAIKDSSIASYELIRMPSDLLISNQQSDCDIKLSCKLVKTVNGSKGKVVVTVSCGQKRIGIREVPYRFKYNARQIIAVSPMRKGQKIRPDDIMIQDGISDYPEPTNFSAPFGKTLRRDIAVDTVITASMIAPEKPEIAIKRNQSIVIKIDSKGLFATAMGTALQSGSIGDIIKVKNTDSRVIIMARINKDHTVTPAI